MLEFKLLFRVVFGEGVQDAVGDQDEFDIALRRIFPTDLGCGLEAVVEIGVPAVVDIAVRQIHVDFRTTAEENQSVLIALEQIHQLAQNLGALHICVNAGYGTRVVHQENVDAFDACARADGRGGDNRSTGNAQQGRQQAKMEGPASDRSQHVSECLHSVGINSKSCPKTQPLSPMGGHWRCAGAS